MSNWNPIDYYSVLEISPNATQQQIRNSYKRAALKTHPDRVPPESPERAECTRKFQIINDAYYTLCDENRRSDYDFAYNHYNFPAEASTKSTSFDSTKKSTDPPNSFPWSSFGFSSKAKTQEEETRFQSEQFGDVFEEMLKEEMMKEENLPNQNNPSTGRIWSILGGLSGATMGFIIANFPGMIVGAVAGNRLGSVRDTKGKSVYEAFQELPAADKTRLLSELAAKVLSHAVGI